MAELLAPAGSMESLKAAIYAGADAIYVGGSRFNARAYATNFDIDELKEAVKLCHLHGVRLFVTVNTLYKENELLDLYEYLCELYQMQVDALIVQDEGIMNFISRHFKDFEIHASTQCSVHNVDGVKHYQNKGIKRVVVARENSIEEIKEMVATGCEIEAFVHGALCVSYSGQCFMSQMIGKRSANRGMCAQPCRLPYQLFKDDSAISKQTYLMSCKDLCTIESIHDLIDAGITSFKIEGRMKRPEYVYAITKAYRLAIDQKEKANLYTLKQLFNRDFTKGYLFHEDTIISPEYSGNRGTVLGRVIGYDRKLKQIQIKSQSVVTQGDGIRIGYLEEGKILNKIYQRKRLIHQVGVGETFEIDYAKPIPKNTIIYKTTDTILEDEIHRQMKELVRKIPVHITFEGYVGQLAKIIMYDEENRVEVTSSTVLEASVKEPNISRIKEQLEKLGNTIYQACNTNVSIDHAFIPIKEINELRRLACEKLDDLRKNKRVRHEDVIIPFVLESKIKELPETTFIHLHTLQQLEACLPIQENEIIFFDLTDEFLLAKQRYPQIGLAIPTIMNSEIQKKCDQLIQDENINYVAVGNVGAYERYKDKAKLLLPTMNLSHHEAHTIYDVDSVLSVDLDYQDEMEVLKKNPNLSIMTYGHIDNMITKHCVLSYTCYNKKIEKCNQCKIGNYHLEDRMNAKFPLIFDEGCIMHVLSEKPIQRKKYVHQYLRFTIESKDETINIIRKYR